MCVYEWGPKIAMLTNNTFANTVRVFPAWQWWTFKDSTHPVFTQTLIFCLSFQLLLVEGGRDSKNSTHYLYTLKHMLYYMHNFIVSMTDSTYHYVVFGLGVWGWSHFPRLLNTNVQLYHIVGLQIMPS